MVLLWKTHFLSQKVTLVTLNFQWSKLFLWWQKSNHKMHGSDSVETLWTTEFRVCYGNVTRFGGAELRSSRSCSAGGAASAIERRATETEMLPRCRAFQIEPKSTSSGHFLSFFLVLKKSRFPNSFIYCIANIRSSSGHQFDFTEKHRLLGLVGVQS